MYGKQKTPVLIVLLLLVFALTEAHSKDWKQYRTNQQWKSLECTCWDFPSCEKETPGYTATKQKKDHFKKAKERGFVDFRSIGDVLMITQCGSLESAKKLIYYMLMEGEGYGYNADDQTIPGTFVYAANMTTFSEPRYIAIAKQPGDSPANGDRLGDLVRKGHGYQYGKIYHFELAKLHKMKNAKGETFTVPVFNSLGIISIDPRK